VQPASDRDPAQAVTPAPPGAAADGASACAAGPWSRALALGLEPAADELVIEAGIGRLRLTPTTVEWSPVIAGDKARATIDRLTAPPDVQAARLAACRACTSYVAERCQIAGCGCAGLGNPAALLSKCPLDLWPSGTAR
jgi:hypothetical protein